MAKPVSVHHCNSSPESWFKEWPEVKDWPWWISVLLWFKGTYWGYDECNGYLTKIGVKYLFGKMYIVKEESKPPKG